MQPGRPSTTAERAALLRAAHQILDHPTVLEDPIALRLLDRDREAALRSNLQSFESPALRRLRASIALRSRYAEDTLRDAVGRGVRQYVILGAGLDSFAYRNPYSATELHVYEVDHPDTQAWKIGRLRDAGIGLPESLTFIPVDFERQTLADAILGGELDATAPIFVSWLGVTVYLTRDAVMQTLSDVSSLAAGSEIVFGYVPSLSSLSESARSALSAMAERAAAVGEPWLTYFEPAVLGHELEQLGFTQIEDFGPEQAFERYFRGRTDGLRPGGAAHLMKATVSA